jgi:hypothetical protein
VTLAAYQDWAGEPPRRDGRPQLALWVAGSVLVHLLIAAWILMSADPPELTMANRAVQDRPAVEVVLLPPGPDATPAPDVTPDPPRLSPPLRKAPVATDLSTVEAVDPQVLEEFLRREALRDKEAAGGQGSSWTTCSLLSPERRVLEPACDGLMLQRGAGPGVAASLQPPDGETLKAIQKFNAPRTAQDDADALGANDTNSDGSYQNQTDDYYGGMPWQKN